MEDVPCDASRSVIAMCIVITADVMGSESPHVNGGKPRSRVVLESATRIMNRRYNHRLTEPSVYLCIQFRTLLILSPLVQRAVEQAHTLSTSFPRFAGSAFCRDMRSSVCSPNHVAVHGSAGWSHCSGYVRTGLCLAHPARASSVLTKAQPNGTT